MLEINFILMRENSSDLPSTRSGRSDFPVKRGADTLFALNEAWD